MFRGVYTAIITPFLPDGEVDYPSFQKLIARQIEAGIDGIVPVGTTGESPTLEMDEHKKVIETAVETAGGRIQVIAGTGANSTSEALELTEFARNAGADASLQVTPYYNKPSNEGLIRHFTILADVGLPVMLYNVPGRTSRALDVSTVIRLAEHPNIVAIKEAAGSVLPVSQYRQECDLDVLSGDDALTLPMLVLGAVGVVSVASNVIPERMRSMVGYALSGQWDEACREHDALFPLFEDLFMETNPIPVKAAAALLGWIEPVYRLPLCELDPDQLAALRATLLRCGVQL